MLKTNGLEEQTINWNAINWQEVYRIVKNLRYRIFKATEERNWKKVRSLQKLMLRSKANVLLSVRRATQENAGKFTAGVDKVVVKTSDARGKLVSELLTDSSWKVKPARRIYIPKSNGKKRPLGIPSIKDRCFQAVVKNALEPEWEALFERSSYGFRPGRGCHDAMSRIYTIAHRGCKKKWVIDADIKGAFDNIDHGYLLEAINNFPARGIIKEWLKAGYMDGGVFNETKTGTPQGSIISPLLANIALTGMESTLGIKYLSTTGENRTKRSLVRYADDFVIFCESKEDAENVMPILKDWLKQRGLELSMEKTRIVHLCEGFNFLGFNVMHHKCKRNKEEYNLLIKPSDESVEKLRRKLKEEWRKLNGSNVDAVITRLNPIIRGWANYFKTQIASNTFRKLDHWMFIRQVQYLRRLHPKKPAYWTRAQYFGKFNLDHNDNWVFGNKSNGKHLLMFRWFKIKRHILVKGLNSPDDPKLKDYWVYREKRKVQELTFKKVILASKQKYVCPVCKESLFNGEELNMLYLTPRKEGGTNLYKNLQLMHMYCHQQALRNRTVVSSLLEPYAVKVARTVLRGEGISNDSSLTRCGRSLEKITENLGPVLYNVRKRKA
ncbi:MAG TPA: group II intron reverse transcriptase/maturase [Cyclobacteriaceae bacterium]